MVRCTTVPEPARRIDWLLSPRSFLAAVIATALALGLATSAHATELDMDSLNVEAINALAITGHRVVKCDLGDYCSAVITSDGELYMWGDNCFGQLGDGTTVDAETPKLVEGLPKVADVSIGTVHCGAVTRDGDLYTWGCNNYGQLGHGTTIESYVPKLVEGLPPIADFDAAKSVTWTIDRNHGFSAAVTVGGELYTWGENNYGQLGDGTTENRHEPEKVEGVSGLRDVAIAAETAAAIGSNGELYMWGQNYYGQLGDGGGQHRYRPERVSGVPALRAVSLGYAHAVALSADGGVYTWGTSSTGQLGAGDEYLSEPRRVPGVPSSVMVSAGYDYTGAVTSDGRLYMWGQNDFGQIGDGHWLMNDPLGQYRNYKTPHLVDGLFDVTDVSLGKQSSAAMDADGNLYGWGHGLIGDGSDRAFTPTLIFQAPPKDPVPVSSDPTVSYVYRLYNRNSGEHLYTVEANEANTLQSAGWKYEGIGWNAPSESDTPIYRLYNPWSHEHLYTTNKNEYDSLDAGGWNGEGVKLYSADSSGQPAWRVRNPWEDGPSAHLYTADANERATLLRNGCEDEGVCWYGLR